MMYEHELRVALRLARRARTIALRYYRRSSRVILKDNLTPVTAADRRIEHLLADGLMAAFPHDRLIGEEHGERHGSAERFWTIDPIDGTRMFVHKTGNFSTMIGLVVRGRPVLGVIAAHAHGQVFHGVHGHGSYVVRRERRRRLRVRSGVGELRQAVLIRPDARVAGSAHSISRFLREHLPVRRFVTLGSAGLDLCAIAQGRASLAVVANPNLGVWDSVPGQIILEEAGGVVTNLAGRPPRYRWGRWPLDHGLVATTPELLPSALRSLHRLRAVERMAAARRALRRTTSQSLG